MALNTFMTASVMKELNAFKTTFTNRDSFFPYWSIIIAITNVWQIVQLENKGMFSDTFKEAIHKSNLRSFEVQIHRKKICHVFRHFKYYKAKTWYLLWRGDCSTSLGFDPLNMKSKQYLKYLLSKSITQFLILVIYFVKSFHWLNSKQMHQYLCTVLCTSVRNTWTLQKPFIIPQKFVTLRV